MTRAMGWALFLIAGIFGLAACEDGTTLGLGSGETASGTPPAANVTTQEGARDVERPDIFTTSELALWDGRPSLGGIWVAHPDVTDPERAMLINENTGQRVAGALFRRERDNPGPRLQVSSEAATALNILAGQPTEMTVVAVRREEISIEAEETEDIAEGEVDDAASASVGTEADLAAASAEAASAEAEAGKPRNFLERIFGLRQAPEAVPDVELSADSSGTADAQSIETQQLDPVASTAATAAAAIARAEAQGKPVPRPLRSEDARPETDAALAEPLSSEAEAAASEDQSIDSNIVPEVRNPFIQIGLFTVQENANDIASNLRQKGIVPTVLQGERDDGTPFWRVVVGPVTTVDDQAAMLARVERLGYTDAFLAPN